MNKKKILTKCIYFNYCYMNIPVNENNVYYPAV